MNRGQLEQRLLVLITLGLVAFGLVMVYSATSASAALGNGDPVTFLKRQGIYALAGVALMLFFSRFDHRRLRLLAPPLVLVALGLCLAVLVIAPEINGAKRWLTAGPFTFQPSELAKVALLIWAAAYLAGNGAPRTFAELWKPIGMVTCLFAALIVVEPDLGTTIALMLMMLGDPGRRRRSGTRAGRRDHLALTAGMAAIWIEPYRRARVFSFLDPWPDPQNAGFQTVQAMIGSARAGSPARGSARACRRSTTCPSSRPT